MKYIKLFEQFESTPLYEEVNSIMDGQLTESEIQDLLNEGFFSWLKGLFSNPKKKRELDKLAKKLVEVRVDIAKINIEQEDLEEIEAELKSKEDAYANANVKVKPTGKPNTKDTIEIKKSALKELETNIIQQMDALGEESESLKKYVNKVKLDSRMESTEQVMRLADARIKRVFMKLHKKDKKASAAINKELQKELN